MCIVSIDIFISIDITVNVVYVIIDVTTWFKIHIQKPCSDGKRLAIIFQLLISPSTACILCISTYPMSKHESGFGRLVLTTRLCVWNLFKTPHAIECPSIAVSIHMLILWI